MVTQTIINPAQEFLIVRHSYLNGNNHNLAQSIEETLRLEKYTNGRTIVPCFEGDILAIEETGEVVLTHQNFLPLHADQYQHLHQQKLASSLDSVLEKVAQYQSHHPNQRVVLCLEAKAITSQETITKAMQKIQEYGIKEVYFDSFFGSKLDDVNLANQTLQQSFPTSLHLVGNLAQIPFMLTEPKKGYDLITVPTPLSFGNLGKPVIYGAVNSPKILQQVAEDPLTIGAYVRFKEQNPLVMLWNSFSNTPKLRQNIVLSTV